MALMNSPRAVNIGHPSVPGGCTFFDGFSRHLHELNTIELLTTSESRAMDSTNRSGCAPHRGDRAQTSIPEQIVSIRGNRAPNPGHGFSSHAPPRTGDPFFTTPPCARESCKRHMDAFRRPLTRPPPPSTILSTFFPYFLRPPPMRAGRPGRHGHRPRGRPPRSPAPEAGCRAKGEKVGGPAGPPVSARFDPRPCSLFLPHGGTVGTQRSRCF